MLVPSLSIICLLLAVALVIATNRIYRQRRQSAEGKARLEEEYDNALALSEDQNHRLLNALSDPFLLLDSEGIIRFANSPAEQLFSKRSIVDQHLSEVFLDGRLAEPVRKAVTQRRAVTTQVILSQQSTPPGTHEQAGETAWLVDAGPVEPDNPVSPVRVTIRNTTAEHHSEQVRKDFVANASHELRTPLAIINGYLENLIEGDLLDDPDTALRFLKIMGKHGRRIARIVEDMLIISRLESGEASTLKVKPFPLKSCVLDVVERLESVISEQCATVEFKMGAPELLLQGDRFYWTQILFNLVENALKQNPDMPLKVVVGWEETEGRLNIWVSDNGVGIPSADLPFIFRRFYRVEKHHSQVEIKGTGLGLSIVRRAVEAHGGSIEVTSIPGHDTRFEITLPLQTLLLEKQDNAPPETTAAVVSQLKD